VTVIPCHPTACRRCGHGLAGDDPEPLRHQVFELPVIQLDCTEYERHRLTCPECGTATCAELPAGVPCTTVGPRLQAFLAMLSGGYRLSKRMIERFCDDVFGWSISPGCICHLEQETAEALEPAVAEARAVVPSEPANVDSTGWRLRGRSIALWVAVTGTVTVFRVLLSRGADAVRELVGMTYRQILTSDRAKCFVGFPKRLRQVCWAHLQRDFQAMIDRGGPGAPIGNALLGHAEVLFTWWHRVRDGTMSRSTFQQYVMKYLRPAFREDLEAGLVCGCAKTAGTCRELLKLEQSLWTFVRHEGIAPTNNDAERPFRHGVQWRKTSYGSMSDHGMQFVENILTVIETCRRQDRNVLQFLTDCCAAAIENRPAPSLLPNK
jgi:transposase